MDQSFWCTMQTDVYCFGSDTPRTPLWMTALVPPGCITRRAARVWERRSSHGYMYEAQTERFCRTYYTPWERFLRAYLDHDTVTTVRFLCGARSSLFHSIAACAHAPLSGLALVLRCNNDNNNNESGRHYCTGFVGGRVCICVFGRVCVSLSFSPTLCFTCFTPYYLQQARAPYSWRYFPVRVCINRPILSPASPDGHGGRHFSGPIDSLPHLHNNSGRTQYWTYGAHFLPLGVFPITLRSGLI
jgi:hypothetical protein